MLAYTAVNSPLVLHKHGNWELLPLCGGEPIRNMCPWILVALSMQHTAGISIWPGDKKAFIVLRSNLAAPSWGNIHPHHKKRKPGPSLSQRQPLPQNSPLRPQVEHTWRRRPGGYSHRDVSVPGTMVPVALPLELQLGQLDLKQQSWVSQSPDHLISLVRRSVILCVFLISKVPREKRSHHKILNSFWKQKKDSADRVCREEGVPDTDTCVCFYHTGAEGHSGKPSLHLKELSSNFIGVAHPSQASSPGIFHMSVIYKYCTVCICAYIHKAKVYINQDKLCLP